MSFRLISQTKWHMLSFQSHIPDTGVIITSFQLPTKNNSSAFCKCFLRVLETQPDYFAPWSWFVTCWFYTDNRTQSRPPREVAWTQCGRLHHNLDVTSGESDGSTIVLKQVVSLSNFCLAYFIRNGTHTINFKGFTLLQIWRCLGGQKCCCGVALLVAS